MSKSEGGVLPVFSPASGTASTAPMAEQRTRPLRHEVGVCLGEFIGTFMFLFLAFTGTQVAITSEESSSFGSPAAKLLYISVAFGGGLAINASIFASLSGAMFNPAVRNLFFDIPPQNTSPLRRCFGESGITAT